MYEDAFDRDWDEDAMGREEAIWRAYALGVAAALGEQHPEEYRELVAATGRPLVEMAYDEGKSEAADLDSRIARGDADEEDLEFPSRERAVWSKLVVFRDLEGEIDADDGGGRTSGRDDLPAFLEGVDLGGATRDDLERLGLPEFLSRR